MVCGSWLVKACHYTRMDCGRISQRARHVRAPTHTTHKAVDRVFLRPANCGPLLIVFQKGFRILADFFQVQALVAGAEDATAVGLAVEVVGFGHFRRCEEAVVFLEVRRQVGVAVLVFDIPADFVDDL